MGPLGNNGSAENGHVTPLESVRTSMLSRAVRVARRAHSVSLMGAVLELCLSLLGSAVLSRMLLPDGRGQLGRWVYWGALVVNLSVLGINSALPQLVGNRELGPTMSRRLGTAFALVLAPLGCVVALAISALARGPAEARSADAWWWIVFCFVPFSIVIAVAQGVMVATGKIRELVIVKVGARCCYVLVMGTLLVIGRRASSNAAMATALWGFASATVTVAVAGLLPIRGLNATVVLTAARRGIANHFPTLAVTGMSFFDQGWIYTHLSDSDAGLYLVAAAAACTIEVVGVAEITASTVAMADPSHGMRHVKAALRRTAVLLGLALGVGYCVAPTVIPLWYGASFAPAVPVFRTLLAAMAFYNWGRVAEAALQSRKHPRAAWVFQATRGAAVLVFMQWFGRRGGLAGATNAMAAASAVAALATAVALCLVASIDRGPVLVEVPPGAH